jgi:hypothetical protein
VAKQIGSVMQALLRARIRPTGNNPNLRLATGPLRSAVAAPIADAADAVTSAAVRMALRATLSAAIADGIEAERFAEALRVAATHEAETVGQGKLEAASASTTCDVQTIDMPEAAYLQLSPQQDNWTRNASTSEQDSWTRNASTSEIDSVEELDTDSNGLTPNKAVHAERAESAVATHIILELHDRLGSFIKR